MRKKKGKMRGVYFEIDESSVFLQLFELILGQCAQTQYDFVQLIEIGVAWEKRFACDDLTSNASNRPNVHWFAIRTSLNEPNY